MIACSSDFLVADDFDTVMTVIDANILENNAERLSEVNSVVKNLPSAKKSGQCHSHICSKIHLSESGFSKHVKSKHPESLTAQWEIQKNRIQLRNFSAEGCLKNNQQSTIITIVIITTTIIIRKP